MLWFICNENSLCMSINSYLSNWKIRLQEECENGVWGKSHHDRITTPLKEPNNMNTSLMPMRLGCWRKKSWEVKISSLNFFSISCKLNVVTQGKWWSVELMNDTTMKELQYCGTLFSSWHKVITNTLNMSLHELYSGAWQSVTWP